MDFRLIVVLVLVSVFAAPAMPYGGGGESVAGSAVASEPAVVKDLAEAVKKEQDPDVRAAATVSLGQFPTSTNAASTLSQVAEDAGETQQVRAAAAVGLGNHGGPENHVALQRLAHADDPILRRHAVLGLGMLKSASAAEALADRLGDGDDGVRRAAARALAFSGSAAARNALEHAARSDANPLVRLESLRTLVQTSGATVKLLDDMAKGDQDAECRELAAAARKGVQKPGRAGAAGDADRAAPVGDEHGGAGETVVVGSDSAGAGGEAVGVGGGAALDVAIRGAGALAAPVSARGVRRADVDSVGTSGATTTVQTRRRVKLKRDEDEEEELNDFSPPEGECKGHEASASPAPEAAPSAAPGVVALTSTTALPRTTGTANGESGRAHPGEPIAGAISRLAARLAPGAASEEEQLRTMHELAPLIDQAAFQGSRVVPLSPAKGRWFLTAHRKISEHEPLVKSTFVNEQGAMFRAESKQPHMPGSTYIVFRYQDVAGKAGVLNGIGAYTYTRTGTPVFKHFGLDGTLDTFSSPKVNEETCFRCHDNKESFTKAKDFTFDTFQRAKENGTVELMEQARTKVAAQE